jgi:hypothetical protein
MSVIQLSDYVTPSDRARDRYHYVPFEVPSGTRQLEVHLRFDEGNVIDLGIADPRFSTFPSTEGFRGWSGGFRDCFAITPEAATPGYLAGEVLEGTWQVLLGLHRIKSDGCHYQLEIRLNEPITAPLLIKPKAEPSSILEHKAGWYPGDLHSHTFHSDAQGSLEHLVAAAEERGLSFLAVTDHNTTSHHAHLFAAQASTSVLFVPGTELTTDDGHANVWGAKGWVDFRFQNSDEFVTATNRARKLGGVISVNHPKTGGPAWRYDIPEVEALEVWQSPWANYNWESLELYQTLLTQGRRITLVGGSDRHQPGYPDHDPLELRVGSPTTWLYLEERSSSAVLKALRSGQAFVSESPRGPKLVLSVEDKPMGSVLSTSKNIATAHVEGGEGSLLCWVGSSGVLRKVKLETDSVDDTWTLPEGERFIRLELVASNGQREERLERVRQAIRAGRTPKHLRLEDVEAHPYRLALSNPIYFVAE